MQSAVLRALEFDRIREALAREALTPFGRERALTLEPSADAGRVQRRLDRTQEAVAFLKAGGTLSIDATDDLPAVLASLGVAAEPLTPLQLLALARFTESIEAVAGGIAAHGSSRLLGDIAARVASFAPETSAVRRAILSSGDIQDDASPALRDIRDALRRQRAKLRSTLEGLTRGRDTAKYLQDQIVTDRNGRYVVVVRAEHRGAIPGIVHGTSASGASLYLEPLTTVDLNNDIVALVEQEKEEILRILTALTDAFRRRSAELDAAVHAAGSLDELQAKARLAERQGGTAPALASDGRIEFLAARHPLLGTGLVLQNLSPTAALAKQDLSPTPTPTDLLIVPPTRALVISGPNTGGKTVALKAVGLLSLMAQAGLLIPVEASSTFTPFKSIFADIGDEQSIAASLSTFSARVANIVEMDRALELPALILLDEVGSGTDPVEGGALGAAVIDHFRRRGAMVIATTHDDALKSYAATTPDVAAAAFGFDPDTYAPTYRLIYGAPGRSLALEIAERLGLPATVVADARARRSGRESLLAAHLARVDSELAALERQRKLTEEERAVLGRERRALLDREMRLAEREAVLKKRLDDKLNERLREARAEVDAVVAELKTRAGALVTQAERRGPVLSTGDVGGLRAQARSALDTISASVEAADAGDAAGGPLEALPDPGQPVFVLPFGTDGVVRGVSGKNVEVEIRGKRMRVKLADLRSPGKSGSHGAGKSGRDETNRQARREIRQPGISAPVHLPSAELILIGATVDDALARAEKFLDSALLADERRLRIVHGHGTGRLRDALRTYFREHALVASVSPAPDNEGGQGATIVELKE
jgi:DNA mismatch repair protein MutS2